MKNGVRYSNIYCDFHLVIIHIQTKQNFTLMVITEEKKTLSHEHLMLLILFSIALLLLGMFPSFLFGSSSFRGTCSCKHKMLILQVPGTCWIILSLTNKYFFVCFYSKLQEVVHFDSIWVPESSYDIEMYED